jgi:hypothetical protein
MAKSDILTKSINLSFELKCLEVLIKSYTTSNELNKVNPDWEEKTFSSHLVSLMKKCEIAFKYDLTRTKAIVDPSKVTLIKVHGCKVEGKVIDNPENLNLNHYITLSQEEFQKKIKRTLGEHTWGNIEHSNNWAVKRQKQYEFLVENYVINKDILKFDKLK